MSVLVCSHTPVPGTMSVLVCSHTPVPGTMSVLVCSHTPVPRTMSVLVCSLNGTISSQHLILRQPLFSDSRDANRAGSRRQLQRSNHSLGIGTLHTRSGSSMDSTAIIHPSAHLNLPGRGHAQLLMQPV